MKVESRTNYMWSVDTGGGPSDSLYVNGFLSVEHRLHALLITKYSFLYETTFNFDVITEEPDGTVMYQTFLK